ncbi:glycosyltransferase family 2 protein [Rhodanobacter thiooxydans]|uniref:glycosyltransferase family 2 protein n=1 Tax=Rhodanobacter thiooxydans TaxID=416169 RepID=UPI0002EBAD90|nr:glycosyltransferase family 2 protein [Rhodanobacter thiooxydans]
MQQLLNPRYSLVIPVYRNAESIDALLAAVRHLQEQLDHRLETLFVIDGSPDDCHWQLQTKLPASGLRAKLILLSRNFGAFSAIREGLLHARGDFAAVMAADLQEPPELVLEFFRRLDSDEGDIAFGVREARHDPWLSRLMANTFWRIYRRFVQRDVPVGGVDVFAVNRQFLDRVTAFGEANGSLLGLLFWMGGRRIFVPYMRRERAHGKSAWSFRKKLTYLLDSVFAFTDAPIRLLLACGMAGLGLSVALGITVLVARLIGLAMVPGYAGTMLAVLFFGGLNALGLGLVGNYAWRAYENTKHRPLSIPMLIEEFGAPNQSDTPREKTEP